MVRAVQLQVEGKSLSPMGCNRTPGTPLLGLAPWQEHSAGRQSGGFSMKHSLHERPCADTDARLRLLPNPLLPGSHQEPFSVLRVHIISVLEEV